MCERELLVTITCNDFDDAESHLQVMSLLFHSLLGRKSSHTVENEPFIKSQLASRH